MQRLTRGDQSLGFVLADRAVWSRAWARTSWLAFLSLQLLATLATDWIQSEVFTNLLSRPLSLGFF